MRYLIPITLAIWFTASLGILQAEDAPKRSAELQVLDRFIGEWESVVAFKGTDEKSITRESIQWSREGRFVQFDNYDAANKVEAHFLITYDPQLKQYRSCFISDSVTVPLLGTWDEPTQTMTWKSTDVAFRHEGFNRFLDKDHIDVTMTVTSPEGKIVLEMTAKKTRVKK